MEHGLVALQKCETIDSRKVPIEHNVAAHNEFRNTTKQNDVKTAGPLSVTQQKIIAQHYSLDGNTDMFVKNLLDQPRVPCSTDQRANIKQFKSLIYGFYRNNPKICQGRSKKKAMSIEVLLEILELLAHDPDSRNNVPAPMGASGDDYYTTYT